MSVVRAIFSGEYTHAVDAQRRLSIPRTWRGEEGLSFYLFPSSQKMLRLLSSYVVQGLCDKLDAQSSSFTNVKVEQLKAAIFRQMNEVQCDKQGRIQLPSTMKSKAEIGSEAVLVAAGSTAQIWSKEGWDEYQELDTIDVSSAIDDLMNDDFDLENFFGGE